MDQALECEDPHCPSLVSLESVEKRRIVVEIVVRVIGARVQQGLEDEQGLDDRVDGDPIRVQRLVNADRHSHIVKRLALGKELCLLLCSR